MADKITGYDIFDSLIPTYPGDNSQEAICWKISNLCNLLIEKGLVTKEELAGALEIKTGSSGE